MLSVALLLAAAAVEVPPPPPVEDPQLAPPPPAPRVLQSWDEALSLIRKQSPDYLASVDNVLRAEAQTRIALAAILPNGAGQVTYSHEFITSKISLGAGEPMETYPLHDLWGGAINIVWPVGEARLWFARKTADLGLSAARSDLAVKRRVITQSIVTAMLGTLAAERVAELNRVGLRAALERLALAQTKTGLGSGTALDVERAQQDVAAARAMVVTGDESLREAREALGLALGSSVPVAAPGTLDLAEFEKAVADTCHLTGDLEQRADIQAARTRIAAAERAIQDVKLQYVPTFDIESQTLFGSQVLYGPNVTWALIGVLNIPIWDGGARYGQMRDALAAEDQAQQALAAARLNAVVAIAQAERQVGVAAASRDLAREQRELAYSIDQRTREGYVHGLGTSLDLVTSAQALRQAEINLVLLQFQASQARVLAILANADCAY